MTTSKTAPDNPTENKSLLRQVKELGDEYEQLRQYVQGSYELIASEDRSYADEMTGLATSVSGRLTRLSQDSVKVVEQMNALDNLAKTSTMVNSSLDPVEVLNAVVDAIVQLTGAERAYIVLSYGDDLTATAARNWDNETVPKAEISFSRSIIKATLEGGEPIVTTNAQTDQRFMGADSIAFKAVRAVMCVPLISRGQTIGVVYADNRLAVGIFNPDTIKLVTMFAGQAAIAIENAHMYTTVRKELEEAQTQLMTLQIHVDDVMRDAALKDITETAYFSRLQNLVREQREKRAAR